MVNIIVAVADNWCIGKNGALPWRIPEDMKRFKELTSGHPVIMGRKTWESLPEEFRPLPNRTNIVVTRQSDYHLPTGVELAVSLEQALTNHEREDVFVIGGAQIYAAALPLAQHLYVTHVAKTVDGDAFFPAIDPTVWHLAAAEQRDGYSFNIYDRTVRV